jgi:hypothetical protein
VIEELDRGRTYEQVQTDLRAAGVEIALSTLKAYRAKARARARKAAPHAEEERAASETARMLAQREERRNDTAETRTPPPNLEGLSVADLVRTQLKDALARAHQAFATGDTAVAARYSKQATELSTTLARLEKAENENKDSIVITPTELADAEHKLRERIRAVLERPLLCAHCSRQVSLDFGGVRAEVEAADAADAAAKGPR